MCRVWRAVAPKKIMSEMTTRLPKPSHHDVKDKRAEAASWLAAAGPASGMAALMGTQLDTGAGKAPFTAVACSLLMLETGLGGWTTLETRSTAQGQASHSKTERQGLLELVAEGSPDGVRSLEGHWPQGTHTGGSCD